jgi:hypothetical protein
VIEAGVRLGRKINEVLVDETAQRPLLLPLGDLFGSVTDADAQRREIVHQVAALDQSDQKYRPKHPTRRILGTVVEVGVDYFAAHPEAMGRIGQPPQRREPDPAD